MSEENILGINRTYSFVDLPQIPDKIERSKSGKYFLVFDSKVTPYNSSNINEALKIFETKNKENYVRDNFFKNESENSFPEINSLLLELKDSDIKKIRKQPNTFKIVKDKDIEALQAQRVQNPNTSIPINWGLHKTNVINSNLTGKGVKVAILDTGWDFNHPDYLNRNITTSFFTGSNAQDDNGHGMHCTGIACGYQDKNQNRYGVAYEADIYACKVLDLNRKGLQSNLIKGIRWAVKNGCKVISISIGTKRISNLYADLVYTRIIQYALNHDCIVVAGVGNDSNRNLNSSPAIITSPADSHNCWAINSIDHNNDIHFAANRANKTLHQMTNFAAPGVDIYSSVSRYNSTKANGYMTGTSMATPFVAGIIALAWQNNLTKRPFQILSNILKTPPITNNQWNIYDYGDGIIQAP